MRVKRCKTNIKIEWGKLQSKCSETGSFPFVIWDLRKANASIVITGNTTKAIANPLLRLRVKKFLLRSSFKWVEDPIFFLFKSKYLSL